MPRFCLFYGRFMDVTTTQKHHIYRLVESLGDYEPMQQLALKDGTIKFTLLPSKESGHTKDNAPDMRLAGKNSFPFTGIKYKLDARGTKTRYGYGNPPQGQTYQTDKPNPFYEHRDDGFLFIFAQEDAKTPTGFELIVVDQGAAMISDTCTLWQKGFKDEELKQLRLEAGVDIA